MYICPNRQQPGHTGAQGQGISALSTSSKAASVQWGNQGEVYFASSTTLSQLSVLRHLAQQRCDLKCQC